MSLPPLTPDQMVKPRHFELRLSLLFAAIFGPIGVYMPYFPLWLEDSGFSAPEIAVMLSAPMFLRVFTTPLFTAMADRTNDRADVLVACVAAALALSFGYFLTPAYAVVLAVSLALTVVWTPPAPLSDSIALSGVRRFGSDYSRMRLWGSAAFLAGNFGGGLILSATGMSAFPVIISAGIAGTLVAALLVPKLGRSRRPASPSASGGLRQGAPSLLTRPFVLFVAGAGIVNASHSFVFAFGSIYWKSLGIGEATLGALWAWAVVAEVGMFMVFTRLFGRVSPSTLLVFAAAAAILRWTATPLVWTAGLGVAGFFAVQTLHAASTGFILLGVQKMIAETVPDHRIGAAQGIAFFANGLAMAAVTLASGPVYDLLGAAGFHTMSAVAVLGTILVLAGRRAQPQSAGEGGDTSDPS